MIGRPQRRVPLYLDQAQIDALALLLYKHQTISNVVTSRRDAVSEEAACFLTEIRKQCCCRSGAADPFPDMPLSPCFGEEN